MIGYRYATDYQPTAHFMHVVLCNTAHREPIGEFPAQLDSGADRTVILQEHVERLRLAAIRQIPIGGFGADLKLLSTYAVKIQIRQFEPILVEVIASPDEPFIILGRDVLNKYRMLLDGPAGIL